MTSFRTYRNNKTTSRGQLVNCTNKIIIDVCDEICIRTKIIFKACLNKVAQCTWLNYITVLLVQCPPSQGAHYPWRVSPSAGGPPYFWFHEIVLVSKIKRLPKCWGSVGAAAPTCMASYGPPELYPWKKCLSKKIGLKRF